jgi:hypothetical protein
LQAQSQPSSDSILQVTAEANGLQLIAPEQVPPVGTFWLVMPGGKNGCVSVPLPMPPVGFLPTYQAADGQFIVDGLAGEVASAQTLEAQAASVVSLINQIQGTQATRSMGMTAMDSPGIPGSGAGGGGGYGDDGLTNYPAYNFSLNTNLLWLQITNVSNGTASGDLFHATNQVYAIWATPDLTIPFSLWSVGTEVFPSASTTNVLPFAVPTSGLPDLFLQAQDWTGVYANGLPCWWTWFNFHTLDLSWTNQDANGNTLGYDYTNLYDPNTITFAIAVTNPVVNTANPSLPLYIVAGSVTAPLGADGAYTVAVGLRGFPLTATQTWESVSLVKNTVFPQLTITNPVSGTISQSPIQFQGFASEPLDTLTYDVTNAAGVFTNQQTYVTGAFYDPILLTDTTNYFQSGNVYLASGANVITLHATDWAGNRTNLSFTANFTPNSAPPVVSLVWPQSGTPILGNNVTLQAHVSDTTASVTATVNGTSRPASVGADGSVWAQNLPLILGNNTVTLTASTALGGMVSTNFSVNVVSNSLALTVAMDWLVPNEGLIEVHGSLNCDPTTNCVYVNGVLATSWWYSVDGTYWTWYAEDVPVNPMGMADVHVEVYQGDPVLVGSTNIVFAQPINVALESYSGRQTLVPDPQSSPNAPTEKDNINWFYTTGGTLNDFYLGLLDITPGTNGTPSMDVAGPFDPPWEYARLNTSIPGNLAAFDNRIDTRVMLQPGGIQVAGTTNLYLVFACAYEASDTNLSGMIFIPSTGRATLATLDCRPNGSRLTVSRWPILA